MARIWIDLITPSDVHLMAAIMRALPGNAYIVTARDRAETLALAKSYELQCIQIGKDAPRRTTKVARFAFRIFQLISALPAWDLAFSFNNMNSILLANFHRRPCVMLMDNDLDLEARNWSLAKRGEMAINLRASRILCPSVFPITKLIDLGVEQRAILAFDGFKEDIYTADFEPNPAFREGIPFDEYVVLRPEALDAVYVRSAWSIVPEIIAHLAKEGIGIVYLPRVPHDLSLVHNQHERIWIPREPPNGLQLVWHSLATITGSGSFAREAACLGVPAVSFFPEKLLAVDRAMTERGWIFHTRDPKAIAEYVLCARGIRKELTSRSKRVHSEVIKILQRLLNELAS